MKRRFMPLLLLLGLLAASCAWAQQVPDTEPPDQSSVGPTPTYVHPEQLPSLDFVSQAVENSSLKLGVNVGASYDSDGAFDPNYGSVTRLFVLPTIGLKQLRSNLAWSFDYTGGLSAYPDGKQANSFSNGARADILYQFAPHWQLHLNDLFLYTTDPFYGGYSTSSLPPNIPNPTIYNPNGTTLSNIGEMDLSYQITAHDTLTMTGASTIRRLSNEAISLGQDDFLANMVEYSGTANFNHQVSPKLSLGGSYSFTSLDFGRGQQRSGIQTFQGTVSYQVNPNISVSVWAGPEYTAVKNEIVIFFFPIVVHETQWSPSGGISFSWKDTRNAFRASYYKQITDGGGIIGTTSLNQVITDYRRQLNARWNLTAGILYGDNVSVSQLINSNKRKLESITARVGLGWKLTPSLHADFFYAYVHESQQNIYQFPTWNDNRLTVTLAYRWEHPLGR